MRYVILFFGGAMFLFWDGYYHDWGTIASVVREIDRLLGYVI